MTDRYARQSVLPEIGPDGQARLDAARVVIVGMGGLGCPAAQYLAGAGIGRLSLVDADTVSESNLHRQILYRQDQIGTHKVDSAKGALTGLNPNCDITTCPEALTPANAQHITQDADVVLDCADSFAVSYILSDVCFETGTPLISASALGTSGYVGGFCAGAPSLRAVFPELPNTAASCATAGVMGPVVGILGSMQAQMAMAHILQLPDSPLGAMRRLDGMTLQTTGFRFVGAPEPTHGNFNFIDPKSIKSSDFVVELRTASETDHPVVPFANRFTVPDFSSSNQPRPNPSQRAVLCCRSGLRAWQAARALQSYWDGDISLVAMGDQPNPKITKDVK